MLAGSWVPDDPHRLDFDKLPRVASQHAVVSSVRAEGSSPLALDHKNGGVNQHGYLAHHNGKFWAMWRVSALRVIVPFGAGFKI
jgi:hypothetical protein